MKGSPVVGHARTVRTTVGVAVALLAQVLLVNVGPAAAPASAATAAPTAAAATPYCKRPAKGFVPNRASIPALDRTLKVIQVKRKRNGEVGAGPVTDEGKWLMAMDPQTKPASRKGSVILSGHTWPDGSALGNALLRSFHEGDRIVLFGSDGKRACYKITERTQYAVRDVPNNKAFRYWGREQVVVVTCSGKRLGPGNWSHRTIWYGVPVIPPKPSTPPPPPEEEPPPSLLGNLLGGLLGGS